MKKMYHVLLSLCLLFTLSFCNSSGGNNNAVGSSPATNAPANNVALLELFTSQGCSSCPPADRLLGNYISDEKVITLSFHVDYWNKLGWEDPYSSRAYTQRQYEYASALHADVYTPQLVVNGEVEMVGSDANKIKNAINNITGGTSDGSITIRKADDKGGKAIINFSISGSTENDVVNIALAEKKVVTKVNAGENGGATLTGYNVVVNFKTVSVAHNGDAVDEINIPTLAADHKNLSVIVFLQDSKTHKISGAAEASL